MERNLDTEHHYSTQHLQNAAGKTITKPLPTGHDIQERSNASTITQFL